MLPVLAFDAATKYKFLTRFNFSVVIFLVLLIKSNYVIINVTPCYFGGEAIIVLCLLLVCEITVMCRKITKL